MFLLTPRYLKEAKHYRHALKRLIHYKKDILPPGELEILSSLLRRLQTAIRSRSRTEIGALTAEIDKEVGTIAPPPKDSAWRENVEAIVVAFVLVAGVRTYFLQPFKIPTGSMQPTLFGIVGEATTTPPPNPVKRAFEFVALGRHYIDVTAKADETVIEDLKEVTHLNFFTFTTIVTNKNTYTVFAPKTTLADVFKVQVGRLYKAGDPIARGHVDTGDQVFVDKMSYNFCRPAEGNVFVFKTNGIRGIEAGLRPGESQHYIKRLAGVPGDTLRIDAPNLFINGKLADLWVFRRVMSCENGYRGYSNMAMFPYLSSPDADFKVLPKNYFALGDNSYASFDSRGWGLVPEQNVAGRGFFVYWPFSKRWGLIH